MSQTLIRKNRLLILGVGLFLLLLAAIMFGSAKTQAAVNVKVKASNKADGIQFSITKVDKASFYKVYVTAKGNGNLRKTTSPEYLYKDVKNGVTYKYIAYAYDKNGKQLGVSNEIKSIMYLSRSNITSVAENSSGSLTVKWNQNAKGSGYLLYRSTNKGSSYSLLKEIKKNTTVSYKDTSAVIGKDYKYRIYVKNGDYRSAAYTYSNITFNHTWVTTQTPATCETAGRRIVKCKFCGKVSSDVIINPLKHAYGKWTTIQEPTCQALGWKSHKCTRAGCNHTENEPINKVACQKVITGNKITDCTKGGTVHYKCKWCGKDMGSETIKPKNHTPVKDPAIPATAIKDGKTEGSHCSVCGKVIVAQKVIPKTTKVDTVKVKKVASSKNGITVKWTKSATADGYIIYRKDGSSKYVKLATISKNSNVKYTDKKAKQGKLYSYKVAAYKKVGSVKVLGKSVNEKAIAFLPDAAFIKGKSNTAGSVTLTWEKLNKISGYQIVFKAKSKTVMKKNIKKPSTTKKTFSNLKKGTYKIYIRSYLQKNGKKYYGNWCKVPLVFKYPNKTYVERTKK